MNLQVVSVTRTEKPVDAERFKEVTEGMNTFFGQQSMPSMASISGFGEFLGLIDGSQPGQQTPKVVPAAKRGIKRKPAASMPAASSSSPDDSLDKGAQKVTKLLGQLLKFQKFNSKNAAVKAVQKEMMQNITDGKKIRQDIETMPKSMPKEAVQALTTEVTKWINESIKNMKCIKNLRKIT